tara:strand:+ start:1501 stop:2184 length:684 start_codon:yes stop_codon:yes gene_type:complete
MPKITSGIVRFKTEIYPQKKELFDQLSRGQNPEALFITCSDSRVDPNLLVQTDPGELFIIRNAGNIVPPFSTTTGGTTASIEYAVAVLGVKHVVICGHSECGAMHGVLNPELIKDLPHVRKWLSFSNTALQIIQEKMPDLSSDKKLEMLIEENVLLQMRHLQTHAHVAAKLATKKIQLHGWTYNIGSGDVKAYDETKGCFVPVEDCYGDDVKAYIESQKKGNEGCCS